MDIFKDKERANKIYRAAIGALLLIVIFQGYLLVKNNIWIKRNNMDSQLGGQEAPSSLLDPFKNIFPEDPQSAEDSFESYFDNYFFNQKSNPLDEMDKWEESLFKNFRNQDKSLFSLNQKRLFDKNLYEMDMDVSTKEKKNDVVMKFKIPGLKKNTLNLDINDKRISLDFDIKEEEEKKDPKGMTLFRSSSHRHISKILPVPPNVDAKKARVKVKDNELIITFPKLKS